LFLNEMYNREFDWPLSTIKMDNYIQQKYNYTSLFILDENINFSFSKVKKIGSHEVASYNRDLNRFDLKNKLPTSSSSTLSANLYDENDSPLKDNSGNNIYATFDRVVYEGLDALDHFEINDSLISPRQTAFQSMSYLTGYINKNSNPIIETSVITNAQNENMLNEKKKTIVYLKKEYITKFTNLFYNELNKIKDYE